ncbi:MAG TPA: carboxypeptidase-like regulatory domain-containing protein [Gemmatimonadales bacterium]|nr:carboxypeptidase-like regulatory domain-containing protein [Gemmatimonadales bacterium]
MQDVALAAGRRSALSAQTVRGDLAGATSGHSIAGGLVLLADTGGRELSRTVADEIGRFELHATAAGSYRLRALRIGYHSWTSPPFELASTETRAYYIAMPEIPIELAALTVEGKSSCHVRPEEGAATAALWDEVKKALSVTYLTLTQVDRHCFGIKGPTVLDSGLIGLSFEPVPGHTLRDVAGVLWLDRQTAELRSLEYRYTNLASWVPRDRAGGRLEFERLPTGAWIVRRWWIRSPVPRITLPDRAYSLYGFKEHGGEVVDVLTADGLPVQGRRKQPF